MSVTVEPLSFRIPPFCANAQDGLAALVYHVSTLAHSDVAVKELVERTASLVLYSLHADSIRLVLRDAQLGSSATFSDRRTQPPAASESFLFSRPITIRGKLYGHLEISVSDARWPATALLLVSETIANLLGRRAEREELRAALSDLRVHVEDLRNRRHLDVLLTRAGGILAKERNWQSSKAQDWIRQEALRQTYPLARFAERLILAHTVTQRMSPLRPGLPIRRSA